MRPMQRPIMTLLAICLLTPALFAADAPSDLQVPTVVLLGDSIRLGYARSVTKLLDGKATVVSPNANGGDSSRLLSNVTAWAVQAQPAVVHFNCGIHDLKKFKATGKFQVSPEQYEANLRAIVAKLRKETRATVLFALTTPIVDDRAAKERAERDYELLRASVEQYNAIARRVMQELDVPVNDLPAALGDEAAQNRLVATDGVHFTSAGSERLAEAVASFVTKHLPKPAGVTKRAESKP